MSDRICLASHSQAQPNGLSAEIYCPFNVLYVEDSDDCARAFQRVLGQYGLRVVIAESVARAREMLEKLQDAIDVVMLDLHLPDGRGEDLLPDIEAIPRQPGIVILSQFLDEISPEAAAYRAVVAPKTIPPARLATILSRAAKGYAQATLSRFAKLFGLTPRELDILDYVSSGATPKQAAAGLDCSIQAIYAHLARVDGKTGCDGYQEVVAKLFQFSCHGLGQSPAKVRRVGSASAAASNRSRTWQSKSGRL